jgi:hypothetical protein
MGSHNQCKQAANAAANDLSLSTLPAFTRQATLEGKQRLNLQ